MKKNILILKKLENFDIEKMPFDNRFSQTSKSYRETKIQ